MTSGVLARNNGFIEGVGGVRLHYRTWEVSDPRAALVLVHGLSDHSGRYAGFAEAVAGYGFSTFAVDLRGHGLSEGRRGHAKRFSCLLQDLDRFRREVQGLVDSACPLILLGHSMGGLVGIRYLQAFDTPFRAAVFSSPWLGTAMPVPGWKRALGRVLNRVLPSLPLPAEIDPAHLSHDLRIVSAYQDDPQVHGTITPRLFAEVNKAMQQVVQYRDELRIPLFFALAGDDRLVDTARTVEFVRSLDHIEVNLRVYEGYFHEVLNEQDPAPVLRDLRDWITAHLA